MKRLNRHKFIFLPIPLIIPHIIAPIAIGIAGGGIHGTMAMGGIHPTIHGHGAGTPIGIRIGDRDGDQVGIPDRITHIIHITHILRYRPEHTVPITPEGIWPITIQPEAIAEVAAELIIIQMAVTEEAQPDVRRQ